MANLIGYWDAQAIAQADATPVSSWTDSVGGRHMVGAGGTRPLLRTGIFNGRQAVRFDGVDDVLTSAASGSIPLTHEMIVTFQYAVAPPATFKNQLFVFSAGGNWHTVAKAAGSQHIAEITRNGGAQQFQNTRLQVIRTTTPYVLGQRYDGSGTVANLRPICAGLRDLFTTAAIGVPAAALSPAQVQIPANVPFNIDVAEARLYDAPLTALELHSAHAAITAKWATVNGSSDLFPTGAQTVFGVGSPGGPGASISVAKPAGATTGDVLVATINLSRDSGITYTITPPANWVRDRETTNGAVFFGVYHKIDDGTAGPYTFAISPATTNGGDIFCDALRGALLSHPIITVVTTPKGSGFPGSAVTTTDWTHSVPGVSPLTRWLMRAASDGRVGVPGNWFVPYHYLEDSAIAAASSWQRRSGGPGARTDTVTNSGGAPSMGIMAAIAVASAVGFAAFGHSKQKKIRT